MTTSQETELDDRISRVVTALLRHKRADCWMNSGEAAAHLRMSKHHFLRLCRSCRGPEGCGDGRLKRWRRSVLDTWQEGRGLAAFEAGDPASGHGGIHEP
jgi:hypothetical protein